MHNQKNRTDDINTILLIVSYLALIFALTLIAIMSVVVYSVFFLLIYGFLKIRDCYVHKDFSKAFKITSFITGIGSIVFVGFVYWLIFIVEFVGFDIIIQLIVYPVLLTGIFGLVKGIIISCYIPKFRIWNVSIAIVTIIYAIFAFIFSNVYFFLHFLILTLVVISNFIVRSAMYLSEYDLTIKNIKNFRLIFWIMSDYPKFIIIDKISELNLREDDNE